VRGKPASSVMGGGGIRRAAAIIAAIAADPPGGYREKVRVRISPGGPRATNKRASPCRQHPRPGFFCTFPRVRPEAAGREPIDEDALGL